MNTQTLPPSTQGIAPFILESALRSVAWNSGFLYVSNSRVAPAPYFRAQDGAELDLGPTTTFDQVHTFINQHGAQICRA